MRHAVIVVGMGFGDEGKGTIVDAIVRQTSATLVVRFNGGAQAGHNVVTADDRHHCFSQIGAGAFAGANTLLSRFVMFDPLALAVEYRRCEATSNIDVDSAAPILTPWHKALNRLRELSRVNPHGSCGVGIGELASDLAAGNRPIIRAADLRDRRTLLAIAHHIRSGKMIQALGLDHLASNHASIEAFEMLHTQPADWVSRVMNEALPYFHIVPQYDILAEHDVVVFEGAQGVLLDEWHGFYPYTTWSTTTTANADRLCEESNPDAHVVKVGVTRAFATRHGAGPLPSELDPPPHWTCGEHNKQGCWQGDLRYGHLDAVLLRYAARVCPVDKLAVTCMDRLNPHGPRYLVNTYWGSVAGPDLPPTPMEQSDRQLSYMRRLGLLISSQPRYGCGEQSMATSYPDDGSFLAGIEHHTGVRVGIVSRGPTATDKTIAADLCLAPT